jgi:DNA invertase Pin-like site-specific DNA recombinase
VSPEYGTLDGPIRREMTALTARLSASLRDLIGFLSELPSHGIDLAPHQQGIDTMTPAGRALFQMMGVFAEFERSMIVERLRGIAAQAM